MSSQDSLTMTAAQSDEPQADTWMEDPSFRIGVIFTGGPTMVSHDASLLEQVESHVRRTTNDRIRHLTVEEDHGRVVISGRVPTYHAKQLALHGALELLPGECIRTEITVG